MKCAFSCCWCLKIKSLSFCLALSEKAYWGKGFSSNVENIVTPAKKRKKEMRFLCPDIDFLLHYDSWKEVDLLGESVDMYRPFVLGVVSIFHQHPFFGLSMFGWLNLILLTEFLDDDYRRCDIGVLTNKWIFINSFQ